MFSPFNFEKLCLKGGLDGLVFLSPSNGQFLPFVRWPEKISDVQKVLYITNGHIFWFCSKKVLRVEEPFLRSRSKRSFRYSTDRMNRSVTILSRWHFPLYFTTDIFPQKLGTFFSENFSCPGSPLYLAKWIGDQFCPRFLEKVLRTAKQALRSAPNWPFYFPTDKMMRHVTVLSRRWFPLTLQRTKFLQIRGWREKFSFHITHGHGFAFCPEKVARYFQKALYYTTDIFLPFFKYRRRKNVPAFEKAGTSRSADIKIWENSKHSRCPDTRRFWDNPKPLWYWRRAENEKQKCCQSIRTIYAWESCMQAVFGIREFRNTMRSSLALWSRKMYN